MDTQTALENCQSIIDELIHLYTSVRILERDKDDEIHYPEYDPSKIAECININRKKLNGDLDTPTDTPTDTYHTPPPPQSEPRGTPYKPCCDISMYSSKIEWCVMLKLLFRELETVLQRMIQKEINVCEYEIYDIDGLKQCCVKNNEHITRKYENNLDTN